MTTRTTNGSFTFTDWQESVVAGDEGGARLAHAVVTNDFTGVIEAAGTHCLYAISYRADGTGVFTGYESFSGTVAGRTGTFVVREWGTFAADAVHCSLEVVPGSGTGGLTGLRGTGEFTAVHGEKTVPYTFTPELDAEPEPDARS